MHRFPAVPASLLAAVAVLAAGAASASARTITWSGHGTVRSTETDHYVSGDSLVSFEADYTWRARFEIKNGMAVPVGTGTVTGSSTRLNAGELGCSGKVTGQNVGVPAMSMDRSGNVTFKAPAIPGWGDGILYACFGALPPPIAGPEISPKSFAFSARAKLSNLLKGTATASDSGGGTFTKNFPSPNPGTPTPPYTRRTQLSWSATVSAKPQTCATRARAAGTRQLQGGVCNFQWLGAVCTKGTGNRTSDHRAVIFDADPITTGVVDPETGRAVAADLAKKAAACDARGVEYRAVRFVVDDPLEEGRSESVKPEAKGKQPVGQSMVTGVVRGQNLLLQHLVGGDGRPILDDIVGGAGGTSFDGEDFNILVPLYRVLAPPK